MFPTVPGLCGLTMMMMPLGFFPISPTISKTLKQSPLPALGVGPKGWGAETEAKGRGCTLRTSQFALGGGLSGGSGAAGRSCSARRRAGAAEPGCGWGRKSLGDG